MSVLPQRMVQYNPTITFDGELIVKDGKMVCLGEE